MQSRYFYMDIFFSFFFTPRQKGVRLSCSLQRKYNVLDEFTMTNSNCLWKNIVLQFGKDERHSKPTIFLTLPKKISKFFTTSLVPVRMSDQAFMVMGPRIATNYGL